MMIAWHFCHLSDILMTLYNYVGYSSTGKIGMHIYDITV